MIFGKYFSDTKYKNKIKKQYGRNYEKEKRFNILKTYMFTCIISISVRS